MTLYHILQQATEFGTLRSRDNFVSFTLKIMFYIIPAIVLGNYTDVLIKTLKHDDALGSSPLYYILLQTLLITATMYLIIVYLPEYISEFQVTIAGGYFLVLYFGMQTNYIDMIKEYIVYP